MVDQQRKAEARVEFVKSVLKQPAAGILITLTALVIFFQLMDPIFLSPLNIQTILRASAYAGIIAVGMGLCLISGVIDLSVGSTAGFSSVLFATSLSVWELPLWISIVLALVSGIVFGLFNAFVILKLKVTPFIATISTMFMIRGLAIASTKGFSVYPLPKGLTEIGNMQPLGLSWPFLIMVIVALIAAYILARTVFGIEIRATGSDYEVAKVTEVRYYLVHISLLAGVGFLAAVSGIFLSLTMNAGLPTAGTGWEFIAITACAIGGVSLSGYEGSIFGIICGMLVMQVLQNGIVMIGMSPYLQTVVVGAVLLTAITLDVRRRKYLNLESL